MYYAISYMPTSCHNKLTCSSEKEVNGKCFASYFITSVLQVIPLQYMCIYVYVYTFATNNLPYSYVNYMLKIALYISITLEIVIF